MRLIGFESRAAALGLLQAVLLSLAAGTATASPAAPPAATAVAGTAVTDQQVNLSWATGGGATTGFWVAYLKGGVAPTSGCTNGTRIDVGNVLSYNVAGLAAANKYTFRVCAYASSKVSSGVTVQATTLSTPPTEASELWAYVEPSCADGNCRIVSMAVDASGQLYASDLGMNHGSSFLRKYDVNDNEVMTGGWPISLGAAPNGKRNTFGYLALDGSGNLYSSGYQYNANLGYEVLVTQKYVGTGPAVAWSTTTDLMLGSDNQSRWSALGSQDAYLYITGNNNSNWFVLKIDTSSGAQVASAVIPDCVPAGDAPTGIYVDRNGADPATDSVYVTGAASDCLSPNSDRDIVIRKFDASLNQQGGNWPIVEGTQYRDYGEQLAIASNGQIYSTSDYGVDASHDRIDWLQLFNPDGSQVSNGAWPQFFTPTGVNPVNAYGTALVLDEPHNRLFVLGFQGTDTVTEDKNWRLHEYALDTGASNPLWDKVINVGTNDEAWAMAADPRNGDIYVAGMRGNGGSPKAGYTSWSSAIRKYKGH